MRILIVKMSSMGDVIHTLPALTDAAQALSDATFDWVVEERFQQLPAAHPKVERVLPIALRRWRQQKFSKKNWGQFKAFRKELTAVKYDLVIDAQGLLKSAFIAKLAAAKKRVGFSRHSAREPMAALFYQAGFAIEKQQHAITRQRQLFANALDYQFDSKALSYGLESLTENKEEQKNIVFLQGTTWQTKHWPQSYWQELAKLLVVQGYSVQVAWGGEAEKQRAEEIASVDACVNILPDLDVQGVLEVLQQATGVVSVDTGFGHLAAALGVPTVAIYGSTNSKLTGIQGKQVINLQADFSCSPCLLRECNYTGEASVFPACYAALTPEKVCGLLRDSLVD